jgi:hypothetical protein
MKIVDTKEMIEFNGSKYQLYDNEDNEIIGGKQLEFRRVTPIPFLKISIMHDDTVTFYRLYSSRLDAYNSRKVIPTRGKYVEYWRILPKKIKNIDLDVHMLSRTKSLKHSSELNQILNKIK